MAKTLSLAEENTRLQRWWQVCRSVRRRLWSRRMAVRGGAVLVNVNEYARLKETVDVLSDPALMKQISRSWAFYRSGKNRPTFNSVSVEPWRRAVQNGSTNIGNRSIGH